MATERTERAVRLNFTNIVSGVTVAILLGVGGILLDNRDRLVRIEERQEAQGAAIAKLFDGDADERAERKRLETQFLDLWKELAIVKAKLPATFPPAQFAGQFDELRKRVEKLERK